MQPYFLPYMGYFHLIAAVDLFILFDCVQFPRRGRVHRTEVPDGTDGRRWLTLPLARQPRETRIDALAFAANARATLNERLNALPFMRTARPAEDPGLLSALRGPLTTPLDFLENTLSAAARTLSIPTPMTRSSRFGIAPEVRREERVRAIAKAAGATHYLNASGGRALYEADFFAAENIALEFISPYRGPHVLMLYDLLTAPPATLRADAAAFEIEPA